MKLIENLTVNDSSKPLSDVFISHCGELMIKKTSKIGFVWYNFEIIFYFYYLEKKHRSKSKSSSSDSSSSSDDEKVKEKKTKSKDDAK